MLLLLKLLHVPSSLYVKMCSCLQLMSVWLIKRVYPWGQVVQLARLSSVLMVPKGQCCGTTEPLEQ